MLSRVAQKMYWFGRYIERCENTARLVQVNSNLVLDLPHSTQQMWQDLTDIIDSQALFLSHYDNMNERNVVKFMLADERNPSSLLYSIRAMRENVRASREILPSEAWEQINEMYWYAAEHINRALSRSGRHDYLSDIINFCHQLTGMLMGSMSQNQAHLFTSIGRNLERADMTTRILDVGSANLLQRDADTGESYESMLWMNILRSLGAYQMYRQHVLERVNAEDVLNFLFKDLQFPRAVLHCLGALQDCFQQLPREEKPLRAVVATRRMVAEHEINPLLTNSGLHQFIDEVQLDLGEIHDHVVATWFSLTGDVGTTTPKDTATEPEHAASVLLDGADPA